MSSQTICALFFFNFQQLNVCHFPTKTFCCFHAKPNSICIVLQIFKMVKSEALRLKMLNYFLYGNSWIDWVKMELAAKVSCDPVQCAIIGMKKERKKIKIWPFYLLFILCWDHTLLHRGAQQCTWDPFFCPTSIWESWHRQIHYGTSRLIQGWSHESIATLPPFRPTEGDKWFFSDFQPVRVSEEPVFIYFFRQNPVFTSLQLSSPVHVVPPLSP